jgi:hypothetical protein
LEFRVNRAFDAIEKGFEAGLPIAFGGFDSIGEFCQKGKDFIRGDGCGITA